MQEKILVDIKELQIAKGNLALVSQINWTIRAGQHWALTGPTGSGKSILLEAIVGKAQVLKGEITRPILNGQNGYTAKTSGIHMVSFTDQGKLFRSVNAVHYYQQRYNAFDADGHLTVKGYLQDACFDENNAYHQELVSTFDLAPLLDTERIKLSSGQTRKLLLCKAFLSRPSILILDNPHIGLDDRSRALFNSKVDELVFRYGITIILSGQLRSLPRCISHCLELRRGKVFRQGPLLGINNIESSDQIKLESAQKYALEKIKFYYSRKTNSLSSILRLQKIKVAYHGCQVFTNLSWSVKQGEKWSVTGENGSGKSTLLGLIYGDHPQAYSNQVYLFGQRRGSGESIWQIKKRVGFTSPELHAYFPLDFTVKDTILSGLWDALFVKKTTSDQDQLVQVFLAYFDKSALQGRNWNSLSCGEQRLLLFIRALVKAPPLLLLDEPYQGLDQATVHLCNKLLNAILTDQHTLIFISHFKDELPLVVTKELRLS